MQQTLRLSIPLAAAGQVFLAALAGAAQPRTVRPREPLRRAVEADWAGQDGLYAGGRLRVEAVRKPIDELAAAGSPAAENLRAEYARLRAAPVPPEDARWAALHRRACQARRAARLRPYLPQIRRIVFTKHYDMGGSHYAYTEGQSDAQAERHFRPGTSLCVLAMGEGALYGKVHTLIDDPKGVIRDPDVSCDGRRILFAWKKSDRQDDYHLYEMDVQADGADVRAGAVRRLTSGLGFADYEGAYLPNGEIVFNSTRCVQTVDCWWTEVSNLYTCDARGRFLRRLSVDQVHTNFPTVTPDGRVIYTRWDYNDRGQIYPQGLFQMNPDGTAQTELYGNNSWFPTTILHARMIPGTGKYVAVFSGHHSRQKGWLGLLDPQRGRQENQGARLIAPVRETKAVRIDAYGQSGDQFQYPYPLIDPASGRGSEEAFLVTMLPASRNSGRRPRRRFAVYLVFADGRRELLVADEKISCNQPIPLAPRPVPHRRPNVVNYRRKTGTVYMQDVHVGGGLAGVPRGTIRRLRVVALEFRAAGIDDNRNHGPAGGALISTPVSERGTWDVKVVLGTTRVHADGSACFTVPALTPLYFQALDANGHAAQTMRSWLTLQPGESVSCVGCHEDKNTAPPVRGATIAMRRPPAALEPFSDPPRGFSFHREIQPILDRHCVRCHRGPPRGRGRRSPKAAAPAGTGTKVAFSLKGAPGEWSDAYRALADRRVCNWINPQSEPSMLPAYHAGAAKSKLVHMLRAGHNDVKLSAGEMARIACWIDLLVPCFGDYTERRMSPRGLAKYNHYLAKRRGWEGQEAENIRDYLNAPPAGE